MSFYMDDKTGNIVITRGDTGHKLIRLRVLATGETYEMQAGDEIHFGVKRDYNDAECAIAKTYTTNPFILAIDPDDTTDLDFGQYHYDMEFVAANGYTRTFMEKKKFKITEEVYKKVIPPDPEPEPQEEEVDDNDDN